MCSVLWIPERRIYAGFSKLVCLYSLLGGNFELYQTSMYSEALAFTIMCQWLSMVFKVFLPCHWALVYLLGLTSHHQPQHNHTPATLEYLLFSVHIPLNISHQYTEPFYPPCLLFLSAKNTTHIASYGHHPSKPFKPNESLSPQGSQSIFMHQCTCKWDELYVSLRLWVACRQGSHLLHYTFI